MTISCSEECPIDTKQICKRTDVVFFHTIGNSPHFEYFYRKYWTRLSTGSSPLPVKRKNLQNVREIWIRLQYEECEFTILERIFDKSDFKCGNFCEKPEMEMLFLFEPPGWTLKRKLWVQEFEISPKNQRIAKTWGCPVWFQVMN